MTQPVDLYAAAPAHNSPAAHRATIGVWILIAIALGLLTYICREGLWLMTVWWESEEYSHGYMIPLVSMFLIYQRLNTLPRQISSGSWWGLPALVLALAAFLLGELSAIYTVIQYAFLAGIVALLLASFGVRGVRHIGVALVYLIFMIPLPNFIYFNLSSQLQLISSEIGVAIIRLFDISVYLEGNVIDLGAMKLQVVEACSGLRYLFPLMSFGFLMAVLYRAPWWQRAILFLSTVPLTVMMNSLRIGLIGVTVNYWGLAMAEGFLHDFEGWIIFMGCILILFLEALLMHRLSRAPGSLLDRMQLEFPRPNINWRDFNFSWRRQRPLLVCTVLLLLVTPWLATLNERVEIEPERQRFSQFPLLTDHWRGHERGMNRDVVDALKLSDYLMADYVPVSQSGIVADRATAPVNIYVAWYKSQKKGASIHSPRSCIPGGGWRMEDLAQRTLPNVRHVSGAPLEVNRAIIRKDANVQLVYYWFEGRGRNITNEYLAKWYIFVDSLLQRRSDGALVRVITVIPEGEEIAAGDSRLEAFLSEMYPSLPNFSP